MSDEARRENAREILAEADFFVLVALKEQGWPTGFKSVGWGDPKMMANALRAVADDLDGGVVRPA